jgi:hypothetical protein
MATHSFYWLNMALHLSNFLSTNFPILKFRGRFEALTNVFLAFQGPMLLITLVLPIPI